MEWVLRDKITHQFRRYNNGETDCAINSLVHVTDRYYRCGECINKRTQGSNGLTECIGTRLRGCLK